MSNEVKESLLADDEANRSSTSDMHERYLPEGADDADETPLVADQELVDQTKDGYTERNISDEVDGGEEVNSQGRLVPPSFVMNDDGSLEVDEWNPQTDYERHQASSGSESGSSSASGGSGGSEGDGNSAPAKSANKDEWLAYARKNGFEGDDDDATKEDLVKKYGD